MDQSCTLVQASVCTSGLFGSANACCSRAAIRVTLRDLTMLSSGGGQGTLFRIAERDLNECR